MPRIVFALALLGCSPVNVPVPVPVPAPDGVPAPAASPAPSAAARPAAATSTSPFSCTEVIGLTITAEWYSAGFELLVPDAQFQARTRPHTFVDQWADPAHAAWSEPVTSPCSEHSQAPERLALFAANWKLTTRDEWTKVLEAFVATAQQRYPGLRELDLFTVLRGPNNETCGDPKSVVDPMIDDAIASIAAAHPGLVHAAPKLEAPDCSVFEKGGPHFTEEGRRTIAQLLAKTLTPKQPPAF
jgi:hypothetical protein